MLNARAIAVQGAGFIPMQLAVQGLWPSAGSHPLPQHPAPGGRLVGLHFRMARPDAPKSRGRKDEILFLKP